MDNTLKNDDRKVADAIERSWVYRLIPLGLWPYAQLARWERPIGWWLLMWPGWWSIVLAQLSSAGDDFTGARSGQVVPHELSSTLGETLFLMLMFLLGAVAMRGAGCTYNDLADRDIDDKVARTRSRPLPSGRVTTIQALIFLLLQALAGLIILLQFNWFSIWLGVASLITIAVYPFMKRVTWWPQLFLGFAFSWGALLGWAVVREQLELPAILLYIASIAWVIGYDTIYAHQDKEDDAIVGVKSTARLFGEKTKTALTLLYGFAILLMAIATWLVMAKFAASIWISMPALAGLLIGLVQMIWQIRVLDIDNPDHCLRLFKSNSHFGWILFGGFSGSLLLATTV